MGDGTKEENVENEDKEVTTVHDEEITTTISINDNSDGNTEIANVTESAENIETTERDNTTEVPIKEVDETATNYGSTAMTEETITPDIIETTIIIEAVQEPAVVETTASSARTRDFDSVYLDDGRFDIVDKKIQDNVNGVTDAMNTANTVSSDKYITTATEDVVNITTLVNDNVSIDDGLLSELYE